MHSFDLAVTGQCTTCTVHVFTQRCTSHHTYVHTHVYALFKLSLLTGSFVKGNNKIGISNWFTRCCVDELDQLVNRTNQKLLYGDFNIQPPLQCVNSLQAGNGVATKLGESACHKVLGYIVCFAGSLGLGLETAGHKVDKLISRVTG